jgi:hypothetical protein
MSLIPRKRELRLWSINIYFEDLKLIQMLKVLTFEHPVHKSRIVNNIFFMLRHTGIFPYHHTDHGRDKFEIQYIGRLLESGSKLIALVI